MKPARLQHRLMAILAADAAGYSRLMGIDERRTLAALDAARRDFREATRAHGGRVVDMAGDSVLAVCGTAAGAVDAALAAQRQVAAGCSDLGEDKRLLFRVGIHLCDLLQKPDGTVYGHLSSREEFRSFLDGNPRLPVVAPKHVMANPIIEVNGSEAKVESTFLYLLQTPGAPPQIIAWGHYHDRLRKQDGQWRIAERIATTEANAT